MHKYVWKGKDKLRDKMFINNEHVIHKLLKSFCQTQETLEDIIA